MAVHSFEAESECAGHPQAYRAAHFARRYHDCERDLLTHRPELHHGDQCLRYQWHTARIHSVAGHAVPARQDAPVTVMRRCTGTHRRNGHDYKDGPGGAAPPAIQHGGYPDTAGLDGLLALCD